jgi:membrane protein YqaA with SNARE-associated domain
MNYAHWLKKARHYSQRWLVLLAAWSFLEASIWSVAPDFLLFPLVILLPKQAKRLWLVALTASMLGGILYWFVVQAFPVATFSWLLQTPMINLERLSFIQYLYTTRGEVAVLQQSVTFIPFKGWTYMAVQQSLPIVTYFGYALISRGVRMLVVAGLGKLLVAICSKLFVHP